MEHYRLDNLEITRDREGARRVTPSGTEDSAKFKRRNTSGYIGYSVTIELTYAKGKIIIASETPAEFAVRPMVSEICSPEKFPARFEGW